MVKLYIAHEKISVPIKQIFFLCFNQLNKEFLYLKKKQANSNFDKSKEGFTFIEEKKMDY